MKRMELAKEGVGIISVAASDPENMRGVDPDRLRRANMAAGRDLKDFMRIQMSNGIPWCVVSVPIASWAKKVFPELSEDEAMERLWEEIFKAVRITEDGDAVAEWRAHCDRIEGFAKRMTEYDFAELHYKNSIGTDLTVKMPENHMWLAGGDYCKGVKFVANMPTEEVFSAPLRTGVEGTLVAAKPLVLNGNVIDGIRFTFREGRIVEIHADKGEETLRAEVELDEGSHYLGEIALVPYDSPISNSGILFYNTLFDENAACHFAFGEAYPACIKGGDDKDVEELKAAGINVESNTHVDFMVGTRDLEIVGTTRDGRKIKVFENGNFAI
jgi:aminopeptidase